ncbi:MAG: class I SAM-dependent methyltransferase [Pseudomonadota bacterium]
MPGKWRNAAPNENSANALATAVERGLIEFPDPIPAGTSSDNGADSRWLMLNAHRLPAPLMGFIGSFFCEQGFRPQYQALVEAGFDVVAEYPSQTEAHTGAIVFAGRSRKANELEFARAWSMVRPGGTIVMAGEKMAGIASLRKWAARQTPIAGNFSKHHAQLFWVIRTDEPCPLESTTSDDQDFDIAPGMFSADGPDAGSKLLAHFLSDKINGQVADFGAGWGYLGVKLLEVAGKVTTLDSYEAHWLSLKAAETNIRRVASDAVVNYYWHDLTAEPVGKRYDWIIMNPPFHVSRASDHEIGAAFIRAAQNALKPAGSLLMVANRELPYEKVLSGLFSDVQVLEESEKYRVFHASRPSKKKGNT